MTDTARLKEFRTAALAVAAIFLASAISLLSLWNGFTLPFLVCVGVLSVASGVIAWRAPTWSWIGPIAAFAMILWSLVAGPHPVLWMDAIIERTVAQSRFDGIGGTIGRDGTSVKFGDWSSYYSGWPAEQMVNAFLSHATGETLASAGILLATALVVCAGLGVASLARRVTNNRQGMIWGIVLFITWPELLYWGTQAGRQLYAFTLFVILLLWLTRLLGSEDRLGSLAGTVLTLAGIVTAHHLTTIFAIYLLFAIPMLYWAVRRVWQSHRSIRGPYTIAFPLVGVAFGFFFWFNYSKEALTPFYPYVGRGFRAFADLLNLRVFRDPSLDQKLDVVPAGLPAAARILPLVRLALLAAVILAGTIICVTQVIKRRRARGPELVLLALVGTFGLLTAAAFARVIPEALRTFLFFSILAGMAGPLAFAYLHSRGAAAAGIICGLLVLLLTTALWGNTTIPLNRYDPQYEDTLYYLYPQDSEAFRAVTEWAEKNRDSLPIAGVAVRMQNSDQLSSYGLIDGIQIMHLKANPKGEVISVIEMDRNAASLVILKEKLSFEKVLSREFATIHDASSSPLVYDNGGFSTLRYAAHDPVT